MTDRELLELAGDLEEWIGTLSGERVTLSGAAIRDLTSVMERAKIALQSALSHTKQDTGGGK